MLKTAITIERPLLERADALARQLKLPRSRLVSLALEEFIRSQESRDLLRRLDEAHSTGTNASEKRLLGGMRSRHRKLVDRW